MTATKPTSLAELLPRMSPDGVAWLAGLTPQWRDSVEHVMNIVGADSFVERWQIHRDDLDKLAYDFALEVRQ